MLEAVIERIVVKLINRLPSTAGVCVILSARQLTGSCDTRWRWVVRRSKLAAWADSNGGLRLPLRKPWPRVREAFS